MIRSKNKRRGFSLVEVAILIVVVGVIGTAALIPLTTFLTTETYQREEKQLQRAQTAVMGYAARRRTAPVTVVMSIPNRYNINGVMVSMATSTISGGRAYLPCPDINGDGLEDRNYHDATGNNLTVNIATLTVFISGSGAQQDLRTIGSCSGMRGLLPWKTLGLPPTDTWGNRRTYAVDAAFSHKLVGFNESTLGENFWQHGIIDHYNVLDTVTRNTVPYHGYPRRDTIRGRDSQGSETRNYALPIGLCLGVTGNECNRGGLNTSVVMAFGSYVKNPPTGAPVAYRKYQQGDLMNGVAFVIVSHGKNGKGAVNAKHNTVECRAGENPARYEAANYPFVYIPFAGSAPSNFTCAQSFLNRSAQFFIINRRNENFDDLVVWATRDKLVNALSNGTNEFAPDLPLFDYKPR